MKPAAYRVFSAIEEILNRALFLVGGFLSWLSNRQKSGILIVKLDSIGDFVMFTGALREFHRFFPDEEITILVKKEIATLLSESPYVTHVLSIQVSEFRRNILERLRWFQLLRKKRFRVAINAMYSTNFDFLDCLVGWTYAARRVALECHDLTGPRLAPSPYYTELAYSEGEWKFEIERSGDLLRYFGGRDARVVDTELWISDAATQEALRICSDLAYPLGIVFPGAGHPIRKWLADRFVDAIVRFNGTMPCSWVICGGLGDSDDCQSVFEGLKSNRISAVNLAGKTDLQLLGALLKQSMLCIANETGIVHMAAALDVPTVCVLGGGHYGRFYPYPNNPLTIHVTNQLPCFQCNWDCILNEPECITRISVEAVALAMEKAVSLRKTDNKANSAHARREN